ncbi:MAG: acylneuraminate cytidylyltransferase family protein [Alphaproteobacteria bacterium]|nr:acylneuraminate cytidylyltransferase family protein [Alphaproteobacteria bacterium]
MRRLCIIPARGGSKRLPRKNVADFLGRPIIAWTIEAALTTKLFDRVLVSTDDAEIADTGRKYGGEVQMRDPALATDEVHVPQVCRGVLSREREQGRNYDVLCCLYATAPLRTADDIAAVVGMIDPPRCNFAIAVTNFAHYPFQALRENADGTLEPVWPEHYMTSGESLGRLRAGNGSTYAASVPAFLDKLSFSGPGMRGYYMPAIRSVDIDFAEELEIAQIFGRHLGMDRRRA